MKVVLPLSVESSPRDAEVGVRVLAAALQMPSEPKQLGVNLERADALLQSARDAGVELAVLPELFNTGYCSRSDYGSMSEDRDGPTLRLLAERSRQWELAIAAGFVEREGRHIYNSLCFCDPDGHVHVYRKRHLVFWECAKFRRGQAPLVIETRWGRVGFAICADMIYRRVWRDYSGRIDLAVISSAWPAFANRDTGRGHWMYGRLGALAGELPRMIARDLDIPVIFANQCGDTMTKIPFHPRIPDRFAGRSSLCDGRRALPVRAGTEEDLLISALTLPTAKGSSPCRSTFPLVSAACSSISAR